VQRALTRVCFTEKALLLGNPLGSLAVCITAVCCGEPVPALAAACGPSRSADLAQAVSWSPSLSAAVETYYVQPSASPGRGNCITATVHHFIVTKIR
jgi:hypothetical protein